MKCASCESQDFKRTGKGWMCCKTCGTLVQEPWVIGVLREKVKEDKGVILVGPKASLLGCRGTILEYKPDGSRTFRLSATQVVKALHNWEKATA